MRGEYAGVVGYLRENDRENRERACGAGAVRSARRNGGMNRGLPPRFTYVNRLNYTLAALRSIVCLTSQMNAHLNVRHAKVRCKK